MLLAAAMLLAWRDRKAAGVVVFAVAAVLAAAWFNHHVTDPLQLGL